ncbi:MAG: hypothetical protein HRT35_05510 [Algicola sp.]|nr:hypothetical protein [Algicola sp.]
MDFKKLKLKKAKVMELSTDVESLPREKTTQVAGGATTSYQYCYSLGCDGSKGCGEYSEPCFP